MDGFSVVAVSRVSPHLHVLAPSTPFPPASDFCVTHPTDKHVQTDMYTPARMQ